MCVTCLGFFPYDLKLKQICIINGVCNIYTYYFLISAIIGLTLNIKLQKTCKIHIRLFALNRDTCTYVRILQIY